METQNALTVGRRAPTELAAWTPSEVTGQIQMIQQLMKEGMKDHEHYGTIPGCGDKKVLLKSGAEKLGLMFRLAPRFEIEEKDLGNGHREYRVTCSLYHINTEKFWGSGVGSCSTMESKYRYRGNEGISTGLPVPKVYWDLKRAGKFKEMKEALGGDGYMPKKLDEGWMICEKGQRQENPDIADTYNTVLKIAKKRAQVDAMLTATAASDIFTQDLEEEVEANEPPAETPKPAVQPAPQAPAKITRAQADQLIAAARAKGIKNDVLLARAGVARLSELPVSRLSDLMTWLSESSEQKALEDELNVELETLMKAGVAYNDVMDYIDTLPFVDDEKAVVDHLRQQRANIKPEKLALAFRVHGKGAAA